ncbi:DNA-processing protein DprA [Archangium sp. Cb G35]|uniref:DNA-processing protein DprA n=1 Tax=Archangium sp. Cb G35 TaxID=1920190 RepID=UPI00093568DF|nr:DNA-processing protein DprA [Archangium sp. Cb G35]
MSEPLYWHLLAHAHITPNERMAVLNAAKALDGDVANLTAWVEGGYPGVAADLRATVLQAFEASAQEAFILEELEAQGMRVLPGRDPAYPKRFKRALAKRTPITLYLAGREELLNARRTIAIIGSRDANPEALDTARRAAAFFARQGYVLVSGNARGIDQTAEESAIEAGGEVVSVLPQGLLDKATLSLVRKRNRALLEGQVALLSELHPKSRWQGRFAMMRNRLIVALADFVLVAQTGLKESRSNGKLTQSGTWAGAEDARSLGRRVFVFDLPTDGNLALARAFAEPVPLTPNDDMFSAIEDALKRPPRLVPDTTPSAQPKLL